MMLRWVRARAARLFFVTLLAGALLYLVAAVSFATVAHRRLPAMALKVLPGHAPSLETAAFDRLAGASSKTQLLAAERLAQIAISKEPLAVAAVRTLALAVEAQGQKDRAAALMEYALQKSRRDLATSIWFIEKSVREENPTEALRHYDMALRTSANAERVLIPVLANAVGEEQLIPHLARTLKSNPPWGKQFAAALLTSDAPPENVVRLVDLLKGSRWFGRGYRQQLVASLVEKEEFELAARTAGLPAKSIQFSEGFAAPVGQSAFSWKLTSNYDMESHIRSEKGVPALFVSASQEQGGPAAKILLRLQPGRYRVASQLGERVPAELQPSWVIQCAVADGAPVARLDVGYQERSLPFSIPTNCPAQWLTLVMRATSSPDGVQVAVKNVEILPES